MQNNLRPRLFSEYKDKDPLSILRASSVGTRPELYLLVKEFFNRICLPAKVKDRNNRKAVFRYGDIVVVPLRNLKKENGISKWYVAMDEVVFKQGAVNEVTQTERYEFSKQLSPFSINDLIPVALEVVNKLGGSVSLSVIEKEIDKYVNPAFKQSGRKTVLTKSFYSRLKCKAELILEDSKKSSFLLDILKRRLADINPKHDFEVSLMPPGYLKGMIKENEQKVEVKELENLNEPSLENQMLIEVKEKNESNFISEIIFTPSWSKTVSQKRFLQLFTPIFSLRVNTNIHGTVFRLYGIDVENRKVLIHYHFFPLFLRTYTWKITLLQKFPVLDSTGVVVIFGFSRDGSKGFKKCFKHAEFLFEARSMKRILCRESIINAVDWYSLATTVNPYEFLQKYFLIRNDPEFWARAKAAGFTLYPLKNLFIVCRMLNIERPDVLDSLPDELKRLEDLETTNFYGKSNGFGAVNEEQISEIWNKGELTFSNKIIMVLREEVEAYKQQPREERYTPEKPHIPSHVSKFLEEKITNLEEHPLRIVPEASENSVDEMISDWPEKGLCNGYRTSVKSGSSFCECLQPIFTSLPCKHQVSLLKEQNTDITKSGLMQVFNPWVTEFFTRAGMLPEGENLNWPEVNSFQTHSNGEVIDSESVETTPEDISPVKKEMNQDSIFSNLQMSKSEEVEILQVREEATKEIQRNRKYLSKLVSTLGTMKRRKYEGMLLKQEVLTEQDKRIKMDETRPRNGTGVVGDINLPDIS
eukprot:snap_masked-scaffold_43-processed-gene-0.7-mRNA-1 protein AED:1.00 eAED:1.00 QI:0/0/0/0/1/1/2/0/754